MEWEWRDAFGSVGQVVSDNGIVHVYPSGGGRAAGAMSMLSPCGSRELAAKLLEAADEVEGREAKNEL